MSRDEETVDERKHPIKKNIKSCWRREELLYEERVKKHEPSAKPAIAPAVSSVQALGFFRFGLALLDAAAADVDEAAAPVEVDVAFEELIS